MGPAGHPVPDVPSAAAPSMAKLLLGIARPGYLGGSWSLVVQGWSNRSGCAHARSPRTGQDRGPPADNMGRV